MCMSHTSRVTQYVLWEWVPSEHCMLFSASLQIYNRNLPGVFGMVVPSTNYVDELFKEFRGRNVFKVRQRRCVQLPQLRLLHYHRAVRDARCVHARMPPPPNLCPRAHVAKRIRIYILGCCHSRPVLPSMEAGRLAFFRTRSPG